MQLLGPLLVMAGVLCIATGALQMAFHQGGECVEQFHCENAVSLQNALAGMTFFSIALILFGLAGVLRWMRRKMDNLP